MATVNFYLKVRQSNEETLILLHFYFNAQKFKYSTGQRVIPSQWNTSTQRVKKTFIGASDINGVLDNCQEQLNKIYRNSIASEKKVTQDLLRNELSKALKKENGQKKSFIKCMEDYLLEKKNIYSPNYLKKVTTLKNHLKEFERKKQFPLSFEKIDSKFSQRFTGFLLNDKEHLNSTIKNLFSVLKTFLVWATDNGLNENLKFRESAFKNLPANFKHESSFIYLTEQELLSLFYLDLSNNLKLYNVRETFCFGCFTGMRFSDIIKISKDNVKGDILHFVTQKTKEGLTIPLNDYSKEILVRNKFSLPSISNQKTNDYLKDLGELAGIKESVIVTKFKGVEVIEIREPKYNFITSHTARRTFCTLSLEKGMRAETVMGITGHKDYKTFKKYITITDKVKTSEMKQVWRKQPILKRVI